MKLILRSTVLLGVIGVIGYGFHLFSESEIENNLDIVENGRVTLPKEIWDANENNVSSSKLKGKFIGLYFSASWCGPCRLFTPKLVEFRDHNTNDFEVLLISSDGSAKAQSNYMKKYNMPWFALKNQSEAARNLSLSLEVEYIPYLVVLDPSGNVITKEGKKDITTFGNNALESWKERAE